MVLVKMAVIGIMLKGSILGGVDVVADNVPHFENVVTSKHKVVAVDDKPIDCGYYHSNGEYTWWNDGESDTITLNMIGEHNYTMWEKKYKDSYGFNKGECEDGGYKKNEEKFYNDYYDHWNVDKVYDSNWLKDNGYDADESEEE